METLPAPSPSPAPVPQRDEDLPFFTRQRLHGPAWFAVLLPSLPVLLFGIPTDTAAAFAGPSAGLRTVGLLAGMAGYVSFAVNLLLGARIPQLERLFGALDRMYRFHRRLGSAVGALLAAHVVLMVGALAVVEPASALDLLRPDPGLRVFAGVVAAAGFVAVLVATIVLDLTHEMFLRVHRLFGVVFAVGALHALRVPAFGALNPVLRGYLWAVTAVGVAAWLYRSGHGRTLVRRHYYRVADITPMHPTITQVTLAPVEEPLAFEPGQLVFIGIDDDAVTRELHPFSITSAVGDTDLRLVIRALGDYTRGLRDVTTTSWAMVEGPYGGFWHDGAQHRRQIWIAGGIGVTPFLSIARSIDPTDHHIDLYYCTEDAEAAVFLDELYAIADAHPELRVIPFQADSLGFLTAEDVRAASGDLSDAHVFMCGPGPMMDALVAQFTALDVPRDHLHFEDFRLRGRH